MNGSKFWLLMCSMMLLSMSGVTRAQVSEYSKIDWDKINLKELPPHEIQRYLDIVYRQLAKGSGLQEERKSLIINGNKIRTILFNYASISRPGEVNNDLQWEGLGYAYEFGPLVGALVVDVNGDTTAIVSDGFISPSDGDYSPTGEVKWGWLPKEGFADPNQEDVAAWSHRNEPGVEGDLTRKPHSWPESFYNATLGRYVWPAFLGSDATTPDEEVFFVVDDFTNAEFPYFPFSDDSTKRGLGLDLECRVFQFNNPLAEDIIFLVYTVINRSPMSLEKVYFGMFGDPHVGGANDFSDDLAFFIPPRGPLAEDFPQRARSMVYGWDDDAKGEGGRTTGYIGYKFLESPTNSENGMDDDDDGIVDETPFDIDAGFFIDGVSIPLTTGIQDTVKYKAVFGQINPRWSGDEDGDWDLEKDDVGVDGIPETGDFGEGNGKPDQILDANGNLVSEPNFGFRDIHESDQIGLTSFFALPFGGTNRPKNDQLMWEKISADSIDPAQELFTTPGDNVFIYGSGPFTLEPQGRQRFSIALLMGQNLDDLTLNSETAQRVLEANYRFAQPPPKPRVVAVPGDERVTLYWDTRAEESIDPLTGENDFEGYKIYRSGDPSFSDIVTITDANGIPFLAQPLFDPAAQRRAQFDLDNEWSGLHPVEFIGRGVKFDLGDNTGLVHEYVDSSVTNGKTYFYAVVSYDRGFIKEGSELPPTESQAAITRDPITQALAFDLNTVQAIPGPPPIGTIPASLSGFGTPMPVNVVGTGTLELVILDQPRVRDRFEYEILFDTSSGNIVYSVENVTGLTESFTSEDTAFVSVEGSNLVVGSVVVRSSTGAVVDSSLYSVDFIKGRIRGASAGSLPQGEEFEITYQYYPVFESNRLGREDGNPVFDGIRLYVTDDELGIDSLRSGWLTVNNTNVEFRVGAPSLGTFTLAPIDTKFRFNATDTTATGEYTAPGDTALNTFGQQVVVTPFRVTSAQTGEGLTTLIKEAAATTNDRWDVGETIVVLTPPPFRTTGNSVMYEVTFLKPADTTAAIIPPTEGNEFLARTSKPFQVGDTFTFMTTATSFDNTLAASELDNVFVVPNPYVEFSLAELAGRRSDLRGDRRIEFRNLPRRCTIRIYTVTGELVDTIEKDDLTSYTIWNLLTNEGQRTAYGVYIYHVDAPGVGQKIGRFALIK